MQLSTIKIAIISIALVAIFFLHRQCANYYSTKQYVGVYFSDSSQSKMNECSFAQGAICTLYLATNHRYSFLKNYPVICITKGIWRVQHFETGECLELIDDDSTMRSEQFCERGGGIYSFSYPAPYGKSKQAESVSFVKISK